MLGRDGDKLDQCILYTCMKLPKINNKNNQNLCALQLLHPIIVTKYTREISFSCLDSLVPGPNTEYTMVEFCVSSRPQQY